MKTSSLKTTLALAATLALPAALSAESLTIYASGDTFIRSDNPTSTAGSGDFRLLVGETASVTANDFRALFNFDLSTLPANAIITSVAFRLRVQDNDTNSGTATLALNLHALTQSWTEGSSSWNNAATGTPWTTPGGTFDSTVLSSASVPTKGSTPATYTWNTSAALVNLVQTGANTNSVVGLLLKDSDETGLLRELVRFISKDETGSTLQIHRPQLVIEYTIGSTVPEPASAAALFGLAGLSAAVGLRRRRR